MMSCISKKKITEMITEIKVNTESIGIMLLKARVITHPLIDDGYCE